MNTSQETHLKRIKEAFDQKVDVKFRLGAREHQSNLEDMPLKDLLIEIQNEAIDLFTYTETALGKLKDV